MRSSTGAPWGTAGRGRSADTAAAADVANGKKLVVSYRDNFRMDSIQGDPGIAEPGLVTIQAVLSPIDSPLAAKIEQLGKMSKISKHISHPSSSLRTAGSTCT